MKFGQVDTLEGIDFKFPLLNEITQKFIASKSSGKSPEFYFGAPVFADKNYKGTLFPSDTKQKNFLSAYAAQFNSIEVNATRYGTPKQSTLQNWMDLTPEHFKFSMKFPQVITHRKDIIDKDAQLRLDDFLVALDFLGEKNGVAFAVMANYFRPDNFKKLISFVEQLPKDLPFAIELRAPEWFENDTIQKEWQQLFFENNITPVITDTPGRRDVCHFHLTNNHLFVRYVGDFSFTKDEERIKQWVDRIALLNETGVEQVWFYAHQPGERRELVVEFYNCLIQLLNQRLNMDLPLLINYYQQGKLF